MFSLVHPAAGNGQTSGSSAEASAENPNRISEEDEDVAMSS